MLFCLWCWTECVRTVVVGAFRPIGAARRSIVLHLFVALMKSPYWGRCDFGVNLIRHRWQSSTLLTLLVAFRSRLARRPSRHRHSAFGDRDRLDFLLKCVISFIKFNKLTSFGETPSSIQTTNATCCSWSREHSIYCTLNRNKKPSSDPQIKRFFLSRFCHSLKCLLTSWLSLRSNGVRVRRMQNAQWERKLPKCRANTICGVASGVCVCTLHAL